MLADPTFTQQFVALSKADGRADRQASRTASFTMKQHTLYSGMQSGPATVSAAQMDIPGQKTRALSTSVALSASPLVPASTPASVGVHDGVHIPRTPALCLAIEKEGSPTPKASVVGSPESQTHPSAHRVPPVTHTLEQ
jgi:hypothetical protein